MHNKMLLFIVLLYSKTLPSIFHHFSQTFISFFYQHNEIIQTKQ